MQYKTSALKFFRPTLIAELVRSTVNLSSNIDKGIQDEYNVLFEENCRKQRLSLMNLFESQLDISKQGKCMNFLTPIDSKTDEKSGTESVESSEESKENNSIEETPIRSKLL